MGHYKQHGAGSLGLPKSGPRISRFAMDPERRRLHDALMAAMQEHEREIPCLNAGPEGPDWLADDPDGQLEAAQQCRGCPVIGRCLAYGLAYAERGAMGGMTEGQRSMQRSEYRQQRQAQRQAEAEQAAATEQDAAKAAQAARQQTGEQSWQQQHRQRTRTGSGK